MFKFFKSNRKYEPLDYDLRKFFEYNLLWLMEEFPVPKIEERKLLIPNTDDFPIEWNRTKQNAFDSLDRVCQQMQVSADLIELGFEESGIKESDMGGSVIFVESDPEAPQQFHANNSDGKSTITLAENLLDKPNTLIATLAHEIAQIRLVDEKRIADADVMLADLTTVFFGFGLFNANAAFEFGQEFDRWGYNSLGYLKLEEWAYALALFSFLRNEDNPTWKQYLSKTLTSDFEKSLRYIAENEDEIFKFEDEEKE